MPGNVSRERLGLPIKPFFYTPDQIAMLLEIEETSLRASLLHYDGRSTGVCPKDKMRAIDISPDGATKHEWRILEADLIRWLRFKKIKIANNGSFA